MRISSRFSVFVCFSGCLVYGFIIVDFLSSYLLAMSNMVGLPMFFSPLETLMNSFNIA